MLTSGDVEELVTKIVTLPANPLTATHICSWPLPTCTVADHECVLHSQVKRLGEAGADWTFTDIEGFTCLHHAARHGRKEVVRHLVQKLPKEAIDMQDYIRYVHHPLLVNTCAHITYMHHHLASPQYSCPVLSSCCL